MSVPYQNPISSVQISTPQSVSRTSVFGTNFSVLNVGGYMEVYHLSDLSLTLTASTYPSLIQLSANTIPIRYTKGNGTFLAPDYITLNSDNISSGRRRLGMLVYVHETDLVYQYVIPNYDTLWNNLTGLTGFSAITYSDYTTVINSRSSAGQSFISGWTASTIEGVGGVSANTANWRIFQSGSGGGGTSGISGISGIPGAVAGSGISGISGISGLSGRSGISGLSGRSGISGISGLSGSSGISGLVGAGTSGISGIVGTGTEGVSGISGLSGGGGGGCAYEYMLVASHSGRFIEDGTNNGTLFWIGDDKCGWDGCTLTLTTTVSRDKQDPIPTNLNFVGIPCPMDIIDGDVITLCGIAYCVDAEKFGAALTFFNCSDFSAGEYPNNQLTYNPNFLYTDNQVCFELTYTADGTEGITSCDSFFMVGLNTQVGIQRPVTFSYSLHISRNCN